MSARRANVRDNIIDSAQQLFETRGFAEVSIDDVMAGAGLTRGSFYSYFESKGALFAAATQRMIEQKVGAVGPGLSATELAVNMIRSYLAQERYDAPQTRCPLIAQTSDRTRTDEAVKYAYELAFKALVELLERGLSDSGSRHDRALVLAALCVGSLTLGRAVDNDPLVRELQRATLAAAMDIGGWETEP